MLGVGRLPHAFNDMHGVTTCVTDSVVTMCYTIPPRGFAGNKPLEGPQAAHSHTFDSHLPVRV